MRNQLQYRIAGEHREFEPDTQTFTDDDEAWVSSAAEKLGRDIYLVYYLRQSIRDEWRDAVPAYRRPSADFTRQLSEANAGSGWLSQGWTIAGALGDSWLVSRDEITLAATWDKLSPNCDLQIQQSVSVRFPNAFPHASPGFYTAVSDAGPPTIKPQRIYINVSFENALSLFHDITCFFCSHRMPAMVKILNDPARFNRPDACTVYLERPHFLKEYAQIASTFIGYPLRYEVPGFAFQWLPGVGFAEEPLSLGSSIRSFGEHRSQLIGYAIARAWKQARPSYETIDNALREYGLDPNRLYLNPGTRDVFVDS